MGARTIGALAICGVASLAACGSDTQGLDPSIQASHLLAAVHLEYNAYNLATDAPYDTVQLHLAGVSGTGASMDEPVTYSVANPAAVEISATGLLHALLPVTNTIVRASMTKNGITLTDSAYVTVISGSPTQRLAQIALQLNPGDSAKIAAGGLGLRAKSLRLIRADANGVNMPTLTVTLTSSDQSVAKIVQSGNNASVTPQQRPGQIMLAVSTYAYGVGLRDSLSFLVGWPIGAYISVYSAFRTGTTQSYLNFNPGQLTVGMGACVIWYNPQTTAVSLVFDDTTGVRAPAPGLCASYSTSDPNGGNVAAFGTQYDANGALVYLSNYRARSFPVAGVYTYRSPTDGTSGTIVVCDEAHDSTCSPANYQWGHVGQ
jgi:hypothetical protein